MAHVGYARVSTSGQTLDVQLARLAGCDKIYREKESATTGRRPQLAACLEYVREGDTLVVSRLDRLARSTLHLCQIAADLQRKGVDLLVMDQLVDTSTSTGRLLFHMLGAIAEFETEIRAERQRDGIALARRRGVRFGRPKTLKSPAVRELSRLRREGASIAELARHYRLDHSTIYRYLREAEAIRSAAAGS